MNRSPDAAHRQNCDGDASWDDVSQHTRSLRGRRRQLRRSGAAEIRGAALVAGSSEAWQLPNTSLATCRGAGVATRHGAGAGAAVGGAGAGR
jgi:hypothetical protein